MGYPPHTHDTWTVFIVDQGAIRYDLEAMHRGAAGTKVTILPPHVVHDGRAAGTEGFRKRVLYLGTDILDERLIGRAGGSEAISGIGRRSRPSGRRTPWRPTSGTCSTRTGSSR
jgi:AraC-like ligand binding domain